MQLRACGKAAARLENAQAVTHLQIHVMLLHAITCIMQWPVIACNVEYFMQ
jgi:hypothetical protein